MAERKDCYAVISRFEKLSKTRNVFITLNRYTERWAADALLESMTMADIHKAMDYYFNIHRDREWVPSWQTFVRSADKLLYAVNEAENDARNRAIMRQRLRESMDES